jgi:hypothetical protein
MTQQTEIWLRIPGYETHYEASNLGRIRSVERVVVDIKNNRPRTRVFKSKILRPNSNKDGRLSVMLSINGVCKRILISRLVCLTFHGLPPEGKTSVLHYDDVKTNNASENLRWGSQKDNMSDVLRNQGKYSAYIDGRSKVERGLLGGPILNEAQVRILRRLPDLRSLKGLATNLAEAWDVKVSTLSSAKDTKKGWQNLSDESLWDMTERLKSFTPGRTQNKPKDSGVQ